MTVADYKRQWVLDRRAELHARGLGDAAVARQMGYKPPYFSQVLSKMEEGGTPGDAFIDRMSSAFGVPFIGSATLPVDAAQAVSPETMARLTRAIEDDSTLVKMLAQVVMDKLGPVKG